MAEGYRPQIVNRVDPAAGEVAVRLEASPEKPPSPEHMVHGRVVDEDGAPVIGATITPVIVVYADGTGGSRLGGLDRMAISNDRGEFQLISDKPLRWVDARVRARALAPRMLHKLASGEQAHEIRLEFGVAVSGRLLNDGKPCPGIAIGLVQKNLSGETFVGESVIGTDEQGAFRFFNIAPDFEYYVYAKMNSLKDVGAVPAQEIRAGASGSSVDAGTLHVQPGHRLRGRVVLADGEAVPADTRMIISRELAWDSQIVVLDAQGAFDVRGLPTEGYSLAVRIPNYRLSQKNPNLDRLNARLVGRIAGDTELLILLEPGSPWPFEDGANVDQDRPLRGVDPAEMPQP